MAGRIPDSFLDEIVARSDIVDIIGARVPLKKAGREYKACCPFHNEKSPSFSVSPDKQFYHCFGCGAHGTVIGFLMQYEKMEFVDAVADLAQRAGLELPPEAALPRAAGSDDLHDILAQAARFFAQNLADQARAQRYLAARGIETESVARFALGYAPDAWEVLLSRFGTDDDARRRLLQVGLVVERDMRGGERAAGFYDRFRDRLMFPIRDARGRVLGFGGRIIDQGDPKYLNSPETPLFHKGRELYGLYEARQARANFRRVLVVEGYMDVVRLHQAGITNAVATLGTATTPEHLNKIFRLTSEVVFCFDGDRAGRQAAWRALENSLPLARDGREFKFMFLPEGHDPDTLVAAEGAERFEARSQSALPLSAYLVEQLASQADLQHVDGRAKLKALAAPLFARLPDGIYREMLAAELAARVGMPAAALTRAFAGEAGDAVRPRAGGPAEQLAARGGHTNGGPASAGGTTGERAAAGWSVGGRGGRMNAGPASAGRTAGGHAAAGRGAAGRASVGRGNLLRQAITLVLQHPAAARLGKAAEALERLEQPGVAVLRELIAQAAGMQQPSTAMLLERWRSRAEYGRLSELAMAEPMVAEAEAAAKELQMAIERLLQEYGPGRRMDELLRKAEELGLNFDEKTELSLLLKSKARPRTPT